MKKKTDQPGSGESAGDPRTPRITPAGVQEKEFRLAFRGYNERDVDVFLDEVTEEMARIHGENRRLREELDRRGGATDTDTGRDEADRVVRRAQDEAARILGDAERRAAELVRGAGGGAAASVPVYAGTNPDSAPLVQAFITRERSFLQGMAGLIQRHAEQVKADMRRAREMGSGPATAAAAVAGVTAGERTEPPTDDVARSEDADEPVDARDDRAEVRGPAEEPSEPAVEEAASQATAIWSTSDGDPEVEPPDGSGFGPLPEPPVEAPEAADVTPEVTGEGGAPEAFDAPGPPEPEAEVVTADTGEAGRPDDTPQHVQPEQAESGAELTVEADGPVALTPSVGDRAGEDPKPSGAVVDLTDPTLAPVDREMAGVPAAPGHVDAGTAAVAFRTADTSDRPEGRPGDGEDEGEIRPSLRELFWGAN